MRAADFDTFDGNRIGQFTRCSELYAIFEDEDPNRSADGVVTMRNGVDKGFPQRRFWQFRFDFRLANPCISSGAKHHGATGAHQRHDLR